MASAQHCKCRFQGHLQNPHRGRACISMEAYNSALHTHPYILPKHEALPAELVPGWNSHQNSGKGAGETRWIRNLKNGCCWGRGAVVVTPVHTRNSAGGIGRQTRTRPKSPSSPRDPRRTLYLNPGRSELSAIPFNHFQCGKSS